MKAYYFGTTAGVSKWNLFVLLQQTDFV